jgi:hypothetical protein
MEVADIERDSRLRCGKFKRFFSFSNQSFRSVCERVLNNQDLTNNHSEAAHKRLDKELCMDHPTLWRFIEGLWKVQKNRDNEYEDFVQGVPATKKRRKFREAAERIKRIVEGGFAARTALEYLRGLANNFSMDQ